MSADPEVLSYKPALTRRLGAAFWELSSRPQVRGPLDDSHLSQPEALEKEEIGESLTGMHMLLGMVSTSESHTGKRWENTAIPTKKIKEGLGRWAQL